MKRIGTIFWDITANIGGLAGLLALAYPVFSLAFKPSVNADPDLHQLVVFTCWILGIAFVGVLILTTVQWHKIRAVRDVELLNTKIYDLQNQQSDLTKIVHNLAHDVRNQILHLSFAKEVLPTLDKNTRESVIERIERNWGMFNLYYLDNLKSLFDSLTGETNAVCLKMVRREVVRSQAEPRAAEEQPLPTDEIVMTVRTLYRDTMSYRQRRENDVRLEKFTAASNSAFAHILSDDTKAYYFLSNDLSADHTYVNTNPRWREFYNKTMVSPIRIENFSDPPPSQREKYVTWGFICVDSLNANYRVSVELELLHAFSDLYFPLLYAFDSWRKAAKASRMPQAGDPEIPEAPEGGVANH